MRIAFLAPEVWPFTPLDSLGEMSHDLAAALAGLGHQVDVIAIKNFETRENGFKELPLSLEVPVSWKYHQASIYEYTPEDAPGGRLKNYFIYNSQLFDRAGLYGNAYGDYEDNSERFIFYNRAALELLLALDIRPDIIHVNNWMSGMVPMYLKSLYAPEFSRSKSVITVHNLSNQGIFWHYDMPLTGLGWEYFNSESLEFYGKINLLKAGLVYADWLVFTSPDFARSALTAEGGYGLDGVLATRKEKTSWVMNGVDQRRWSPENDSYLAAGYSWQDPAGKLECKNYLRRRLDLPDSGRPLLLVSGRLGERRGFEAIVSWVDDIMALGFDLAVLGQSEHSQQSLFRALKETHGQRLGLSFDYDPQTAHIMLAGSDIILMPSATTSEQTRYLKAQIYGTVPVAFKCGPAGDNIVNHTDAAPGNGFLFERLEKDALLAALQSALASWRRQEEWAGIMRRAMRREGDWGKSALAYQDIYQALISRQA